MADSNSNRILKLRSSLRRTGTWNLNCCSVWCIEWYKAESRRGAHVIVVHSWSSYWPLPRSSQLLHHSRNNFSPRGLPFLCGIFFHSISASLAYLTNITTSHRIVSTPGFFCLYANAVSYLISSMIKSDVEFDNDESADCMRPSCAVPVASGNKTKTMSFMWLVISVHVVQSFTRCALYKVLESGVTGLRHFCTNASVYCLLS